MTKQRERLIDALNSLPSSRWRDAALLAMSAPEVSYDGSVDPTHFATARGLIDSYQFRLAHTRNHDIDVVGIEELLEVLKAAPDTNVRIEPFTCTNHAVGAFWNEEAKLLACVTVSDWTRERGLWNWRRAMGESV